MNKKTTVDYPRRHLKEDVSLLSVYRYLNKPYNTLKKLVHEISVKHTKSLFGSNLSIHFTMTSPFTLKQTTNNDEL